VALYDKGFLPQAGTVLIYDTKTTPALVEFDYIIDLQPMGAGYATYTSTIDTDVIVEIDTTSPDVIPRVEQGTLILYGADLLN